MRILIADDSEIVRRAIRTFLAKAAHCDVCGEAAHGQQALQRARELRPDLVLLDIRMPVANGFETARLIRQEMPEIKILLMSQGDAVLILPSALEAGADGCVDKARIASDLMGAIETLERGKISGCTPT